MVVQNISAVWYHMNIYSSLAIFVSILRLPAWMYLDWTWLCVSGVWWRLSVDCINMISPLMFQFNIETNCPNSGLVLVMCEWQCVGCRVGVVSLWIDHLHFCSTLWLPTWLCLDWIWSYVSGSMGDVVWIYQKYKLNIDVGFHCWNYSLVK